MPIAPPRFHRRPAAVEPRTPPVNEASVTVPSGRGVNPPGNDCWNVKQFGSSATCCTAAASGTSSVTATVGQLAEPVPFAASTSPTSSVRPPSLLNTPSRVLGFRKKML